MKKYLIPIGAFITAFVVVVVIFTTFKVENTDSIGKIEQILYSKELVESVLSSNLANISDFDANKINEYVAKVEEMKNSLAELQESKACKSEKYSERCAELSSAFEKIEASAEIALIVSKIVAESQDIAGVSEATLNEMKTSSNKFLSEMAEMLISYREKVAAFKGKYVAGTESEDFVSDYSTIDELAREMEAKYSSVSLEQLFGASKEEILSFYDKAEELKSVFAEEK